MRLDFAWLGQGLALDLTNTYVPAQGVDLLDEWLVRHPWQMERGESERLRQLATQVVDHLVFSGSISDALATRVNKASLGDPDLITLGPNGDRLVTSGFTGAVARDLIYLVAERVVLRRCGAPGCGMAYRQTRIDQRWCSRPCGNRARVARHASRPKSGT
jgi:hypothetical protein